MSSQIAKFRNVDPLDAKEHDEFPTVVKVVRQNGVTGLTGVKHTLSSKTA